MSKFSELINNTSVPVLVDFYADWCQPCKMMAPVLESVADKMDGKIRVIKVNVDNNPVVSRKYKIQGIPTLILFRSGQVVWRQSGVMRDNELIKQVERFL